MLVVWNTSHLARRSPIVTHPAPPIPKPCPASAPQPQYGKDLRATGTLLVGLYVSGTPAAREAGGTARRWQVLTVQGGRILDICGFGDRTEAAARAGVPA